MNTPSLALADGGKLPAVGLGFWKVPKPAAADLVRQAVRTGYRHLDCACDYGNEPEVGAGIAGALASGECRREELWVTSKLWNTYHARQHVRPAVERGLAWIQALSARELELGARTSEIDVSDPRTTGLLLMSGTRVLCPAWPPGVRTLSALRVVLADLERRGTLAEEVDMRYERQVIVRPPEPAAPAGPRRG